MFNSFAVFSNVLDLVFVLAVVAMDICGGKKDTAPTLLVYIMGTALEVPVTLLETYIASLVLQREILATIRKPVFVNRRGY